MAEIALTVLDGAARLQQAAAFALEKICEGASTVPELYPYLPRMDSLLEQLDITHPHHPDVSV